MQKLKLLLLWWIFTLVWIFNFSSAESYNWLNYKCSLQEDNSGFLLCTDDYLYFWETVSWFVLDITSDPDYLFDISIAVLPDWPHLLNKSDFPINVECNKGGCDWLNIWNYPLGNAWIVDVSVTLPWKWWQIWEWWTILNWFSDLTPAIDWLKVTIALLIPYVVYIWIWVLLAVLWFYAIRWLVNWMSNKINSYFKSKRG